ncbi:MAG: Xaa-Pro dipeptidase [Kiritimatiellia bacterium]|jgi:Xaa-Pro dipeptidase
MKDLFAAHIRTLQSRYEDTLTLLGDQHIHIDAVLLHSGTEQIYWADDAGVPFRAHAHFNHWVPVDHPEQMVLIQPGEQPTYFQVIPEDFWYDQSIDTVDWWADAFDIIPLKKAEAVMDHLPPARRIAFIGANTEFAGRLGLPSYLHNEKNLVNRLDYHRSIKTPYEVNRIHTANVRGLVAHAAAEQAFLADGSERDIHRAFLAANDVVEQELPYHSIVALDEKSAILHYQNRRTSSGIDHTVCLVDAGYRQNGYASDITRTFAKPNVHPVFLEVMKRVDALQLELAGQFTVGTPYEEIHKTALSRTMDHLLELEILRGDRVALEEAKVERLFLPHGIGHMLGIQVHDVAGMFKDETGVLVPPQEDFKHLRMTRTLEPDMVYTIEPGIYFMPLLLNPERETEKGAFINWSLVDELLPLGGARFEDNIQITADGPVNLTRPDAAPVV